MSPSSIILLIFCVMAVITAIFLVIFGQITVRKLRKSPITKDALGFEFISGMNIINVAIALALPRKLTNKIKKTPLAVFYADADLLYKHTTAFDRTLAKIHVILSTVCALTILSLMLVDLFGTLN